MSDLVTFDSYRLAMPVLASLSAAALIAAGAHASNLPPVAQTAPIVTATPQHVPDIVLVGMAAVGFAIVAFAARRRHPGRRVTS